MKHPDVLAWEEWLNSEEGKSCAAPDDFNNGKGQFLENRLWRAFMAGRHPHTKSVTHRRKVV